MIQDVQEYLQVWERQNNPFYPKEMRWDRAQVNRMLADYKAQNEGGELLELCRKLKDAHELPNDNSGEYNLGYVDAMRMMIRQLT